MIQVSGKTVALIDPLWIGHHPMYFGLFAAAFLRSGARVIGLCPNPKAALLETLSMMPGEEQHVKQHTHFHFLTTGKRSFFKGRFEGDPLRTFQRWKNASDTLNDAEADFNQSADFVFFPYLDSYLRFFPFKTIPGHFLDRPWSGLYLRNHHHAEQPSLKKKLRLLMKGDGILLSPSCVGIGVLDERIIPHLAAYCGKSVEIYPDVTYSCLPEKPFPLATEISTRAGGRKIIGMIGLERRKGLLTLLKTAERARKQNLPYYFVCAGFINLNEFSSPEQAWLISLSEAVAHGEIDNLYFDIHAGRIPAETDFNSVFSTFDIAWVAYENFQGSSGALGKAAAFEIPCIATAGECIGHRVNTYHMGLTLAELDPRKALEAIDQLLAGQDWSGAPLLPDYMGYREMHSQQRLDDLVAALLA